mgnify:CR=1 FL=1
MQLTRFERARILGARSLQLSLGAPSVLDGVSAGLEANEIAAREFTADSVPLTVQRTSHAAH